MKKIAILLVLLVLFVSVAFAIPDASPWTGVAYTISDYLDENLKDPKSLDIIECSKIFKLKGNWVQREKYRAANSFGGNVIENQIFLMEYNLKSSEYEVTTYIVYNG